MFFQKFKTPGIAHVAYIFGEKEEAVVVDPRRDVDEYLRAARDDSLQLKFILETHRQEDFVVGSHPTKGPRRLKCQAAPRTLANRGAAQWLTCALPHPVQHGSCGAASPLDARGAMQSLGGSLERI